MKPTEKLVVVYGGGGGGEGVECTEDDRSYEVTKYQPWF